jgi:hypothetical protein
MDRRMLENNLHQLLDEQGVDIIGQLTKEMSSEQVDRLLHITESKLSIHQRQYPMLDEGLNASFDQLSVNSSPKQKKMPDHHSRSRSMTTGQQQPTAAAGPVPKRSLPELSESPSSTAPRFAPPPPPPLEPEFSPQRQRSEADYRSRNNDNRSRSNRDSSGGAKHLSVHFEPSQLRPSPPATPSSSRYNEQRRPAFGSSPNLRPKKAKRPQHQLNPSLSSGAMQQRRYGSLPRNVNGVAHSRSMVDFRRRSHAAGEYDNDVMCSTCSSSSSDSEYDDTYAYQMPSRKAYGGVRVSYVPNDRRAAKMRHSSGGGGGEHGKYDRAPPLSDIAPPPMMRSGPPAPPLPHPSMTRQFSQPIVQALQQQQQQAAAGEFIANGNVSMTVVPAERENKNCVIS